MILISTTHLRSR